MRARIPPAQQNRKKLMKLTCLVEINLYSLFGELLNHADRHGTRWCEIGNSFPEEAAACASMNRT